MSNSRVIDSHQWGDALHAKAGTDENGHWFKVDARIDTDVLECTRQGPKFRQALRDIMATAVSSTPGANPDQLDDMIAQANSNFTSECQRDISAGEIILEIKTRWQSAYA